MTFFAAKVHAHTHPVGSLMFVNIERRLYNLQYKWCMERFCACSPSYTIKSLVQVEVYWEVSEWGLMYAVKRPIQVVVYREVSGLWGSWWFMGTLVNVVSQIYYKASSAGDRAQWPNR